ncbi:MAG: carbon-nitrogen hydrolase family protein [bacterium]|nr:carbon-nitrogen hydrolase family protein [bacterium]
MSDQPPARFIRVAALQPQLEPAAAVSNMLAIRRMVVDLTETAPLDVVVLPEAFDGGGPDSPSNSKRPGARPETAARPESLTQRAADARSFLGNLARAGNVNVIGGSIEFPEPDGTIRNTCFVVDRRGQEVGQYDKRTLFSREADRRSPGSAAGVFEIEGFKIGLLICADLWRPELARELVGAVDLLCVPAMTAVPAKSHVKYARALWHSLALTRAMENGLAVAVADWPAERPQQPVPGDRTAARRTFHTCGATTICDPSHRPDLTQIQTTIPPDRPGAARTDLDLHALTRYREYRQSVGLLPI